MAEVTGVHCPSGHVLLCSQQSQPLEEFLKNLAQPQQDASVKLVHLALPVRLTRMSNGERSEPELVCTYDIHAKGARLLSLRGVKTGDLVSVERGRCKSVCRVIWTADPDSALRGQFTVECIEGSKSPWEEELRQMQEHYLPIDTDAALKAAGNRLRRGDQNRRRSRRFQAEGEVDLVEVARESRSAGRLEQISEHGCLVSAGDLLMPGTQLRMVLNLYDVSVALKGNVKYAAEDRSMGVEFREIRQGDRPLLNYVLNQLKKPRRDEFAGIEVIPEPLAAVAG
jgi:PilZ domain